jgi:hypothetical protein
MNVRMSAIALALLAVSGWSTAVSAQQRIEFQRQKFDRSRFERAGQPAAPAPAAEPVGTWPPPAAAGAPAPMATEAPAAVSAPATGFPTEAPPAPAEFGAAPAGAVRSGPPPSYPPAPRPRNAPSSTRRSSTSVPSKCFNNAKDYPELVELQKKTGACMLVYFKNPPCPTKKGLCSWFERKHHHRHRLAQGDEVLHQARNHPATVLPRCGIWPPSSGGPHAVHLRGQAHRRHAVRLPVFSYPEGGGRPTPIPVPDVLASLKAQCTPAYQTLF